MFTRFHNNGLKIIFVIGFVLFFTEFLFAQTTDISESTKPKSVKENIIAEESSSSKEEEKEEESDSPDSVSQNIKKTDIVQEEKSVINNKPEDADKKKVENKISGTAEQTEENSAQQSRKNQKPVLKISGLLNIQDGDFKYSRIPGITLKKKEAEEKSDNIQNKIFTEEPEEPVTEEIEEKSIIGMEKGAADIFVKVLLVCLIIGIIILFKFRSKRRNSKVVRRFPGA